MRAIASAATTTTTAAAECSTTTVSSRSLNQQLLEAAKNGENDEVCRLALLQDGKGSDVVDVNIKDNRGYTVLHYCSNRDENRHDDGDTVGLILDKGAIVDAKNHEGCTPLHYASKNGLVDTASLLLEKGGAHVNIKNVFEWTPLMYCAEHNQTKVACLLLGKGASVHTKNRAGCTPLHYASMAGHVSIIHLLLGMGADAHVKRKDGKTPLQLAKNAETARVLAGGGGSSLQAALQQQQGGSSLQAALEQEKSPSPPQDYTSIAAGTGCGTGDRRLDALIQTQENITVSLQDKVDQLEMILAKMVLANAQNNSGDDNTTMGSHDSEQENVKAPVATITIKGSNSHFQTNKNGNNNKGIPSIMPMGHRLKKKAQQSQQQQQQQQRNMQARGRYSMTVMAKQHHKKSRSGSEAQVNRLQDRTVLEPIRTNPGSNASTTSTTCARFSPPHHPMAELVVPPRTSTPTKLSSLAASLAHNSSGTNQGNDRSSSNNKTQTAPSSLDDQHKMSRMKRSGLLDRVALYEKDAGKGILQRNESHHQDNNNEEKARRRKTNRF